MYWKFLTIVNSELERGLAPQLPISNRILSYKNSKWGRMTRIGARGTTTEKPLVTRETETTNAKGSHQTRHLQTLRPSLVETRKALRLCSQWRHITRGSNLTSLARNNKQPKTWVSLSSNRIPQSSRRITTSAARNTIAYERSSKNGFRTDAEAWMRSEPCTIETLGHSAEACRERWTSAQCDQKRNQQEQLYSPHHCFWTFARKSCLSMNCRSLSDCN